jgi:hypothetical protein
MSSVRQLFGLGGGVSSTAGVHMEMTWSERQPRAGHVTTFGSY